jgi:hypothetical protein
LIERAAQNRKVCFWPGAHAPGVVDYLRSVGHGVPSPGLPLSSETGSWQSRLTDKVRVPTAEETVEQNLFDRRMIFLRIGWMHSYEGIAGGDAIIGGGAFVTEHGYGHEIFNFRSFQGAVYGFVQPPGRRERWEDGKINIARLGVQTDDDRVSGVLVVWVATSPDGGTFIIGWYKNATIYRERQPAPPGSARRHLDDDCGYYVTASAEDARLLPPDERVFSIPQLGRGGPGQSNIWYADDPDQHRQLRLHVLRYIESEQLPTMQHDEVPRRRQPDPLFRQRVEEIAVDKTKDYFTRLGYRVKSVEEDNVGWDLTAVLGERELKLEVKGLSGSQVVVELINHLIIICTSTGIGG